MTDRQRLASLDIVRGVVMVLMAVDHVRVYSGQPAGGPSAGIFFTRWITHFCAPAFVFFAGTGAFLYGHGRSARTAVAGDKVAVARYLVTRGLILVILELTVIRASWTFDVDYSQFILAGVIWMLGWCMILLAALVWLPTWAVGAFGLLVILFQNVFGLIGGRLPESWRQVWEFVYPVGAEVTLGQNGPSITVLYTIVPWIGVMAAGYAFGAIMLREPAARREFCLRAGLAATAMFLILGSLAVFMQPASDGARPALFRLLNQQKYPASQLFLLMTLGPAIALLAVSKRASSWFARVLATFGRVPLFYYLLHIPLIHATALVVWLLRDGSAHAEWFATAPYVSVPPEQRWSLPLLYLVFILVVAALYPLCRWYAGLKATRPQAWMRYV